MGAITVGLRRKQRIRVGIPDEEYPCPQLNSESPSRSKHRDRLSRRKNSHPCCRLLRKPSIASPKQGASQASKLAMRFASIPNKWHAGCEKKWPRRTWSLPYRAPVLLVRGEDSAWLMRDRHAPSTTARC